jgi:hypothetical protein
VRQPGEARFLHTGQLALLTVSGLVDANFLLLSFLPRLAAFFFVAMSFSWHNVAVS